ncbi:hypothetical protein SETIT_8G233400v2 [Setaria italica]|uniref:Retrovirus-related Pol polyprotein from transposon TNT 1-94-like beta-barrel domain-containing protein n=1 Tax=Setaria italica TaxID=4555 RepID=K3ZJV8_SETIT|nr:uncharacterized protein LOC101760922 [Setaria italica]RCV39548.1 hypothetical protein SETIT_8G233400v2 [Setaria italica]
MASPPARSDSVPSSSSLLRSFAEFPARLTGLDGDAFQPASRREDSPNEGILQVAKEGETEFILDSGASVHVVGDSSLLSSFRTITAAAAAAYRARDGRQLVVAGVGTISQGTFQLSDVLHVPGLPVGVVLVSVTQLAERGYLVMFGGGRCHVKDQSTGNMVGNGRLHSQDGLYHLEFLKIPPDTTDTTAPLRSTPSSLRCYSKHQS